VHPPPPRTAPKDRLHLFRSPRSHQPIHSAERTLLWLLIAHLSLMPWALGSMWWQTQLASLAFSLTSIVIALLPRRYDPLGQPAFTLYTWPKLLRFPPFWLGLILLLYMALQGTNPWWAYQTSATRWWLTPRREIFWLPVSITAPFVRFNLWRQVIIYADTLLTVCSIWVGLTQRRSIRILLGALVGNACLLGVVLAAQNTLQNHRIPWPLTELTKWPLSATFVYENHAGAYFALIAFSAVALGIWSFDYGKSALKKSTPAGLWSLLALYLSGAVVFTLSRGAILCLGLALGGFGLWLLLWRRRQPRDTGNLPVKFLLAALVAVSILAAIRYLDFSAISARFDLLTHERGQEGSVAGRIMARSASIDLWRAHGLRGIGAGGFRYLFPEYLQKYPSIFQGGNLYWEHAHCDWLEIPIELGLFGDLIILAAFLWSLRVFCSPEVLWNPLAVALLFGCFQTLVHATFDFPFQCPAILVTWCALIALAGRWSELTGTGASNPSRGTENRAQSPGF
jgi:hypothetical protein